MSKELIRILYVDDSANDRAMVRDALIKSSTGFQLSETASRAEFESMLKKGGWDLVLTDFNILGYTGLDILKVVKENAPQTPVIVVTGTGNENVAVKAIKGGAEDYIVKSTHSIRHLPETVQAVLESKRIKQALQESEEKFKYIFENSMIGKSITLPSGEMSVNKAFCEMLGYPEEELQNKNWKEITHPDDIKLNQKEADALLGGKCNSFRMEKRYLHKDGSVIWADIASSLRRNQDGHPMYFITSILNITEKKQAEVKLRESEDRYRAIVETQTELVDRWLPDGTLTFVNEAYCRFYGQKQENLLGKNWMTSVAEEDRAHSEEHVRQLIATLRPTNPTASDEHREVTGDGTIHWLQWIDRGLFDKDGKLVEFQSSGRDITKAKVAEEELNRRLTDLQVLFECSTALNLQPTPQLICETLLEILQKHLHWHHAIIRLKSEESNSPQIISISAPGVTGKNQTDEIFRLNSSQSNAWRGMAGRVFSEGQTLRSGNLTKDQRYLETYKGMLSGLYTPMKIGDEVIGVISIESDTANAFDLHNERLLDTLSEITANAIYQTQLRAKTDLHVQHLAALRAIDTAISSVFDLRMVLDIILEKALSQLHVDAADILLFNPVLQMLEYETGLGFHTGNIQSFKERLGQGHAGRAALERRIFSELNIDPGENPVCARVREMPQEGIAAHIAAPLIVKGEVKGVLELFHRSPLNPDADWLSFLEILAKQTAIAIENASLFENIRRSNLELSFAYDETIEGWSRAMDFRDKETEGHTKRVTDLTMKLAEEFHLNAEEMMNIRRGALLHDIGKMGVPDHILLKPSGLSEEETTLMRRHPQFAYEMLSNIKFLIPALDIPYCHHEKWDGTGYPRGLKGEQIPLPARIFAVVDVFDALISDRPYRKAWTREKALNYITSESGKHFEPRIVDAFLKLQGMLADQSSP